MKKILILISIVLLSCQSDRTGNSNPNLTHADQTIQQFERENKDKITAKYKTNVFVDVRTEGCDSSYCKVHFYLLNNDTAKTFDIYGNHKNCEENYYPPQRVDTIDNYWKSYKYPTIKVNSLPCQTIKIQSSRRVTVKDNLPISKIFQIVEITAPNSQLIYPVQEICLSADTLMIGYDYANQPVYLYKY